MTVFVQAPWVGWVCTVVWFVALTNAFNWLDHMNGLSAGIAAISSLLFFWVAQGTGQTFTAVLAVCLAGVSLGYLPLNFPAARLFMGDAGAQCLGFMLAAIGVVGTFYQRGYLSVASVVCPILILAIPIFDMIAVLLIRLRRGEKLWVGDANHFSHRLVRLGMSRSKAVLFIYLLAVNIGVGATLLIDLSWSGALLLLCQSGATLCIIAILMSTAGRE